MVWCIMMDRYQCDLCSVMWCIVNWCDMVRRVVVWSGMVGCVFNEMSKSSIC